MEWVQSVFLGVFLKFSINIFLDTFSFLMNFEKLSDTYSVRGFNIEKTLIPLIKPEPSMSTKQL